MDTPKSGGRGNRRMGARRAGRLRRTASALAQLGRRRAGRGGRQDERVRDIVAEGLGSIFRRRRRG